MLRVGKDQLGLIARGSGGYDQRAGFVIAGEQVVTDRRGHGRFRVLARDLVVSSAEAAVVIDSPFPAEYGSEYERLPGLEQDVFAPLGPDAFDVRERLDNLADTLGGLGIEVVRRVFRGPALQIVFLPLARGPGPLRRGDPPGQDLGDVLVSIGYMWV